MAMITKNEYGIVAVNNSVLSKMIIDNLLAFHEDIIPCSKKGKIIKKGLFTGYNDFANAIEIKEIGTKISVKVYVVSRFGGNMSGISDQLFDLIEEDFDAVCLDKPSNITVHVWGVLKADAKQPIEKHVELIRENE